MLTRGRTLIRKTSLLRKIEPIARRSSFANKDHLQPAHLAMGERRNDLEIVKGRAIACTIQPGSISSLRCQKSRMSHPGEDVGMRSDVFADDMLFDADLKVRLRPLGFDVTAFAIIRLAEP